MWAHNCTTCASGSFCCDAPRQAWSSSGRQRGRTLGMLGAPNVGTVWQGLHPARALLRLPSSELVRHPLVPEHTPTGIGFSVRRAQTSIANAPSPNNLPLFCQKPEGFLLSQVGSLRQQTGCCVLEHLNRT